MKLDLYHLEQTSQRVSQTEPSKVINTMASEVYSPPPLNRQINRYRRPIGPWGMTVNCLAAYRSGWWQPDSRPPPNIHHLNTIYLPDLPFLGRELKTVV